MANPADAEPGVILLIYPAIFSVWKWRYEMRQGAAPVEELARRLAARGNPAPGGLRD